MPRKASPLSSTSIGNLLGAIFYSPHDMCFAWSVLYYLCLCLLVYHNHPCCTQLFERAIYDLEYVRILYVLRLYLLSLLVLLIVLHLYLFERDNFFALVLHLDLLEHGGGFVLKKLLISHASLSLF